MDEDAIVINTENEKLEEFILEIYEIIEIIGRGAYGVVWKAKEKASGKIVALKKVFDAFENQQDAQRTYREVSVLNSLRDHEDVVSLLDIKFAENGLDVYLIFEFIETDLYAMVKDKRLEPNHKRWVMYQLFRALKFLHSGSLVHRDIKPNNLLIGDGCDLKLCDFGLARSVHSPEKVNPPPLTDYVATRWYRAPELLFGSAQYDSSVDMWAAGCILGELLLGSPLFPGTSTTDQINKVLFFTGRPSAEDIEELHTSQAAPILESLGLYIKDEPELLSAASPRAQVSSIDIIRALHAKHKLSTAPLPPAEATSDEVLAAKFPGAPPEALDLLRKLVKFNPRHRLTAAEALAHPYLEEFAVPSSELSSKISLAPELNDDVKFGIDQYKAGIQDELKKRSVMKIQRRRSNPIVVLSPVSTQRQGLELIPETNSAKTLKAPRNYRSPRVPEGATKPPSRHKNSLITTLTPNYSPAVSPITSPSTSPRIPVRGRLGSISKPSSMNSGKGTPPTTAK